MNPTFNGLTKAAIETQLRLLPEVTWDRWTGALDNLGIFGWVAREDGKSDFVLLRFDAGQVIFFMTSSAQYSREFAQRLGFNPTSHAPCKRVEDFFTNVNATHLRSPVAQS